MTAIMPIRMLLILTFVKQEKESLNVIQAQTCGRSF
jgi:hypothetical protein